MVNLIAGCRLFIQLKVRLNFENLGSIHTKSHQGILKNFFYNPAINKLEYGGANFAPIAKPLL